MDLKSQRPTMLLLSKLRIRTIINLVKLENKKMASDVVKIQELANINAGLEFKGPEEPGLNPIG